MQITEIESLANGLVVHQLLEYEGPSFRATQERFLVDDPSRVSIQGPTRLEFEDDLCYVYGAFISIYTSDIISIVNKISSLERVRQGAAQTRLGGRGPSLASSDVCIVITRDCIKLGGYTLRELICELNEEIEDEELDREISYDSDVSY